MAVRSKGGGRCHEYNETSQPRGASRAVRVLLATGLRKGDYVKAETLIRRGLAPPHEGFNFWGFGTGWAGLQPA